MQHISVVSMEEAEARQLPKRFGKAYEPHGAVTLETDVVVTSRELQLVDLRDECLAIVPDTVSWTFLDREERAFVESLQGSPRKIAWLEKRFSGDTRGFVSLLFRRGLVLLNGETSVDPTIFRDSANTQEQHLVELLVTEKCNLSCGYCLAGAKPGMPKMSRDIATRAVDLAFAMTEAQGICFEFSGGEPFLQFELMRELVAYAQNHRARGQRPISFTIQTNCTLLDEERVAWLAENDISVGISLDGNPASHNASRPLVNGRESFSKVLRGLDLLQGRGVSFGALVVLNRSNVEDPVRLLDFLAENGIHSFKLNPVAYLGTGRENWQSIGLEQHEVVAYFQRMLALLVDGGYPLREANTASMCEFWVSKRRSDRCHRAHCGAGESFQAISATGEVFPCGRATQSPALSLGNVASDVISLSTLARRSDSIAQIKRRSPSVLDECGSCAYRQLCQAGCSVQAYEKYGTVLHRTPECHFFKTMYPWLARWLVFDDKALSHLSELGYFGAHAQRNHSQFGLGTIQ